MFLELNYQCIIPLRDITSIELGTTYVRYHMSTDGGQEHTEQFDTKEKAEDRYMKVRKEMYERRLLIPF